LFDLSIEAADWLLTLTGICFIILSVKIINGSLSSSIKILKRRPYEDKAEINMISKEVMNKLLEFRDERDWRQFHDPKNLAEAISIESSELMEIFLWSRAEESRQVAVEKKTEIAEELADILAFCLLFANETGIDIEQAMLAKIEKNSKKYPVEKAKGSSKKYKDLK
jgi:NTP pyrophosphatase (non-canonical NTP hydrolase)